LKNNLEEEKNKFYLNNENIKIINKKYGFKICNFCKNGNYTHTSNFDYCYTCQKIFCKKCENKHKNSKECNKTKISDKNPKDT
jgi:hypothetical protein